MSINARMPTRNANKFSPRLSHLVKQTNYPRTPFFLPMNFSLVRIGTWRRFTPVTNPASSFARKNFVETKFIPFPIGWSGWLFTFQSCDANPTSQSLCTNFSASRGVEGSRSARRCRITSARSVRSVNDLNAVKKLRILRILSLAAIWPTKEKSRRGIPRFTVWNGGKSPGTKLSRPACTRAAEGRVRGNESKENFVRVMIHCSKNGLRDCSMFLGLW